MVKGVSRQVIVVRPPDARLFEQAIFLLRDDERSAGVTDAQLLQQAQRAVGQYLHTCHTPRRFSLWQKLLWSGAGAALSGLIWLLLRIL